MAAVPAWRSSAAELLRVVQRRVVEGSGWLYPLLCVRLLHGSGWGPGAGNEHRRVEAQPQRGRLAAHATATATAAAAAATASETTADASDAIATACGSAAASANAAQRRAADSAARHLVNPMRAQHTDEARAVKRSLRLQPSGT